MRVRAIGYEPGLRPIHVTAGAQSHNFALKQDINRLNEVVVTGTVGEGAERSKVPFAVGRLTEAEIPVPALDPITALEGKVAGLRIAQTSGQPGSHAANSAARPHVDQRDSAAARRRCSSSTA